jgi:uncharacterized membrane protein YraQ (UPF0718 family)
MNDIIPKIGEALLMAFGMFWKTGWSLVLGFFISAILQAVVSKDRMRQALGRDGAKEIAIASLAGAASSSCSYASAAISRTLFKKGAALIPSLAFLFASTNLVIELGIILYLLLGWQFMLGEWIGGVVLVIIMSVLVRLTYPRRLVEEARQHPEAAAGHEHGEMTAPGETLGEKLRRPETRILVAQNFVMDWSMLWKDLLLGFVIAGVLSAFVPDSFWQSLFLHNTSAWVRAPANALLGPLVAVITFVCSIGNVPMAAVLWGAGVSFGGVLAFLYADLIVIPLLDVYRRYYGWKMAAYIGVIFYITMAAAALIMDGTFNLLGWIPPQKSDIHAEMTHFALDYTFWLNLFSRPRDRALYHRAPASDASRPRA